MKSEEIRNKIFEVRGQRIMLDFDLAELYEVETRALNQAVKRNLVRFPERFMFQLKKEEWLILMSQIVISKKEKRGGRQKLPLAFTEHGVTMLSSILRSKKAVKMNIAIVDAFIALNEFAFNYKELAGQLATLENKYNKQFKDVYEAINFLLQKDKVETEQKERKRIGYKS